ncbi:hypothetical protein D3C77_316630 [compost metagenome]
MNDPAEVRAVLRLYGNNKTVSSDRNQLILKHLGHTGGANHCIQLLPYTHLSAAKLPANLSQLRTGGIQHLRTLVNAAFNLILKRLLLAKHIAKRRQQLNRFILMNIGNVPLYAARALKRRRYAKQFVRIQCSADPRPLHRRHDINDSAKGRCSLQAIHLKGFICSLQQPLDLLQFRYGAKAFSSHFAQRCLGIFHKHIYNFMIFHRFQNFLIQKRSQLPSGLCS